MIYWEVWLFSEEIFCLYFYYQKVIAAQRIVQGMRAKFQFVSKRIENSDEYADRLAWQIKRNKLAKMEKVIIIY